MSIKFIDTLEPNGSFNLIDSKHISYTGEIPAGNSKVGTEYATLEAVVKDLHDTVFAEPTMEYLTGKPEGSDWAPATISFDAGGTLSAYVKIKTPSPGNCTIEVYRSLDGGTSYVLYKTLPPEPVSTSQNEIKFEDTSAICDYFYRIKIKDGLNKQAMTAYTRADGTKIDYLDFNFKCSGLFCQQVTQQSDAYATYSITDRAVPFGCSYKLPRAAYAYLVYTYYKTSDVPSYTQTKPDSSTINYWEVQALGAENTRVPGLTLLNISENLPIPNGFQFEESEYAIKAYIIASDVLLDADNLENFFNDCIISTDLVKYFEVLPQNSILAEVSLDKTVYESNKPITMEVRAKTNISRVSLTAGSMDVLLKVYCSTSYNINTDAVSASPELFIGLGRDNTIYQNLLANGVPTDCTVLKQVSMASLNGLSHGTPVSYSLVVDTAIKQLIAEEAVSKNTRQSLYITAIPSCAMVGTSSEVTFTSAQKYGIELEISETKVASRLSKRLLCEFDATDQTISSSGIVENTRNLPIENDIAPSAVALQKNFKLNFKGPAAQRNYNNDVGFYYSLSNLDFAYITYSNNDTTYLYSPLDSLTFNDATTGGALNTEGIAIELYAKIEDNALANNLLYCSNQGDTAGLIVSDSSIKASCGGSLSVNATMGDWCHIVFVLDKNGRNSDDDEEYKYENATLRLYLNGVLSALQELPQVSKDKIISIQDILPLIINGQKSLVATNSTANNMPAATKNGGLCSLKVLRIYETALTDAEVVNNYEATLKTFENSAAHNAFVERNKDNTLAKVVFLPRPLKLQASDWYGSEELTLLQDFTILNSINGKTPEKDTKSGIGSEYGTINGAMLFIGSNEEDWRIIPDVDIFLQGTSTLAYPVKNYKIKAYYTEGTGDARSREKYKFIPPGKTEDNWPTASNTYTLKCDYMEQSHRNNTPTAKFYQDAVLDAVIDSINGLTFNPTDQEPTKYNRRKQYYSPARQIKPQDSLVPKYRDSIDGIPCALYYSVTSPAYSDFWDYVEGLADSHNDKKGIELDKAKLDIDSILSNLTYSGTYMFNVDKKGDQLGFKISKDDAISAGLVTDSVLNEEGKFVFEGYTCKDLPCISYEGAANNNASAAAFLPYNLAIEAKISDYYEYIIKNNTITVVMVPEGDTKYSKAVLTCQDLLPEGYSIRSNNIYYEYTIPGTDEGEDVLVTELVGLDKVQLVSPADLAVTTTAKSFKDLVNDDDIILYEHITEDALQLNDNTILEEYWKAFIKDKNKYLSDTLEPRYSWINDEAIKYAPIDNAINWVYSQKDNLTKFKSEFSNYFSLEYSMAYYLQMMLFAQIDNAGKNAMFDTWATCDGDVLKMGKIFPRPYDMDSQMGINNRGMCTVPVTAELHYSLTPSACNGTLTGAGNSYGIKPADVISNWESTSTEDSTDERFKSYNTAEALLWRTFANAFKTEINSTYAALRRNNIYDVENICSFIDQQSTDLIGETFYNADAHVKYLSTSSKLYHSFILGNRCVAYKAFLQKRLAFLDSVFNYTELDDSTANTINLSMSQPALQGNDLIRYKKSFGSGSLSQNFFGLVIATHTPQYVSINVGSGEAIYTRLVCPTDTYTLQDDNDAQEGALFWLPISATKDKECSITGAENIKFIKGFNRIGIQTLDLTYANKLTELNLSNCKRLESLTLGNQEKLTTINICDTKDDTAVDQYGIELALQNCTRLSEILANNAKIRSFVIPENVQLPLERLEVQDSVVETLAVKNCANLTESSFKLAGSTINQLAIENCEGIVLKQSQTSSTNFVSELLKIPSLSLKNNSNIKYLNLTRTDATKLQNLTIAEPNLQYLSLYNHSASKIFNTKLDDSTQRPTDGLDLSSCTSLKELNLGYTGCYAIEDPAYFGYVILPETVDKITLSNSTLSTVVTASVLSETDDDGQPLAIRKGLYDFKNLNLTARLSSFKSNTGMTQLRRLSYATNDEGLFYGCNALSSITSCHVTSAPKDMFWHCGALSTISADTSIKFAFADSSNTVTVADRAKFAIIEKQENEFGIQLSSTKISAANMFSQCSNLSFDTKLALIKKIMAIGCSSVSNILAYGALTTATAGHTALADGTLFEADDAKIADIIVDLKSSADNDPDTRVKNWLTNLGDEELALLIKRTLKHTITHATGCLRSNSSLTLLGGNLFANCVNLKQAAHICDSCTNLSYVGADLFYDCKNLKNLNAAFNGCSQLGTTQSRNDVKCILQADSSKLFNCATNELGTVEAMFSGCSNLVVADGLAGFFEQLTKLQYARLAFYGCAKLNKISNYLFKNNTLLKTIDGIFANSFTAAQEDVSLPEALFEEGSENLLESAIGAFSGCTKLCGTISSKFFKGLVKLTDIGAGTCTTLGTSQSAELGSDHPISKNVLGMFANTGIYAWIVNETDLSSGNFLPKLESCSYLFARGTGTSDFTPAKDDDGGFIGFSLAAGTTPLPGACAILGQVFRSMTNLKNIAFAFAGCGGCHTLKLDTTASTLSGLLPQSIKKAIGTFYNCVNLELYNSEENERVAMRLLKGLSNLTDASYLFTNCSGLDIELSSDTLAGCRRITGLKAAFMNTSICGMVPVDFFDDCKSTLVNIEYMFSNTKITSIGTGWAEVNTNTMLVPKYANNLSANCWSNITKGKFTIDNPDVELNNYFESGASTVSVSYDNTVASIFENYIGSAWTFSDHSTIKPIINKANLYNFILHNKDSSYELEYTMKPSFTQDGFKNELMTLLNNRYSLGSETAPEFSYLSLVDDVSVVNFFAAWDEYRRSLSSYMVDIKVPGLLGDCPNLTHVVGLFANCTALTGRIPADLFSGQLSNTNITDISFLFANCYNLYVGTKSYTAQEGEDGSDVTITYQMKYPTTIKLPEESDPVSPILATPINQADFIYGNPYLTYPFIFYREDIKDNKLEITPIILNMDATYNPWIDINDTGNPAAAGSCELLEGDCYRSGAFKYFLPADWFSCIPKVTTCTATFAHIGDAGLISEDLSGESLSGGQIVSTKITDKKAKFHAANLMIPNQLFSECSRLRDLSKCFLFNFALGSTILDYTFLESSEKYLSKINYLFLGAPLKYIAPPTRGGKSVFNTTRSASSRALTEAAYAFAFVNDSAWPRSFAALGGTKEDDNAEVANLLDTNYFKLTSYTMMFAGCATAPASGTGEDRSTKGLEPYTSALYTSVTTRSSAAWYSYFSTLNEIATKRSETATVSKYSIVNL